MKARGNSVILRARDKFFPRVPLRVPVEDGVLPFEKGDTVPQQVWIKGAYEDTDRDFLRKVLPRLNCFADIGASVGIFTLLASRSLKPPGQVYSFDASPTEFAKLQKTIRINNLQNVTAENLAVGDGTEKSVSIQENADWHGANSRIGKGMVDGADYISREVACVSLDSYFAAKRVQPDFMKIDVDGYETRVIAGARNLLAVAKPSILIEMMWINDFGASNPESIWQALDTIGYQWFGIFDHGQSMDGIFDHPITLEDMAHRRRVTKAKGYPARNLYAVHPDRLPSLKHS